MRSELITVTCMLPASTCLEASSVAARMAGSEMALSVSVSKSLIAYDFQKSS